MTVFAYYAKAGHAQAGIDAEDNHLEQGFIEVVPVGVAALDERDFPRTPPSCHLFFPHDSRFDRVGLLVSDKLVDLISTCEAGDEF